MDEMDLGRLIHSELDRVVAVEYDGLAGNAELFRRLADGSVEVQRRPFQPFLLTSGEALASQLSDAAAVVPLEGNGAHRVRVSFSGLKAYNAAVKQLKTLTGQAPSSPLAPYRVFSDMTQQMLTALNVRLFRGMAFGEVKRMQLDIETACGEGHHFSNPDCPEDEVILVSLKDTDGFEVCISNKEEGGEAALLNKMISLIRLHDPDVIEGHNIFPSEKLMLPLSLRRAVARAGSKARTNRALSSG